MEKREMEQSPPGSLSKQCDLSQGVDSQPYRSQWLLNYILHPVE